MHLVVVVVVVVCCCYLFLHIYIFSFFADYYYAFYARFLVLETYLRREGKGRWHAGIESILPPWLGITFARHKLHLSFMKILTWSFQFGTWRNGNLGFRSSALGQGGKDGDSN